MVCVCVHVYVGVYVCAYMFVCVSVYMCVCHTTAEIGSILICFYNNMVCRCIYQLTASYTG